MVADAMEWGVASLSRGGETISGDQYLIVPVPDGILMAVVDGLGHGPEAALAADKAVSELHKHAHSPLISVIKHCHAALQNTRGVVMTVIRVNTETGMLSWLGIGNVEGRLVRGQQGGKLDEETLLPRGGVVGHDLPSTVVVSTVEVQPGTVIILATDGIHPGFTDGLYPGKSTQQIADDILANHAKGSDDALVLVARLHGGAR